MIELEALIEKIRNNDFHDTEVQIPLSTQGAFAAQLRVLGNEMLGNKWCRENEVSFLISHNNMNVPVNMLESMHNIPKEFFDAQIANVEQFMDKIYTLRSEQDVPYALSENIDTCSPIMETGLQIAEPDILKHEYEHALAILYSSIDGFYERHIHFKDLEVEGILPQAIQKISVSGVNLSHHQKFFLGIINANFKTLHDIFSSAGKVHHVNSINSYVKNNENLWPQLFVSKMTDRLQKAGQAYLDEVRLDKIKDAMGKVSLRSISMGRCEYGF